MESRCLFEELRHSLRDRHIAAGIALLDEHRHQIEKIDPGQPDAGRALGCVGEWLDVGYDANDLLSWLLQKFPKNVRQQLPLGDYVYLRLAEAVLAMRREELPAALGHLQTVLELQGELEDPEVAVIASLWKARCLRKAGEYDQALDVTRRGIELALAVGLRYIAAVMRALESWILFQNGEPKKAVEILQEAEAVMRDTDDFITLGNIQSAYGRIAMREGRYDHAMQYFEASIEYFRKRPSLQS